MLEYERNAAFVRIVKEIAEAAQKASPNLASAHNPAQQMGAVLAPVAEIGRAAPLRGVPGQRPNYLRRQEYLDRLKQAGSISDAEFTRLRARLVQ